MGILDSPVLPKGLFDPAVDGFTECYTESQKTSQALRPFLPKRSSPAPVSNFGQRAVIISGLESHTSVELDSKNHITRMAPVRSQAASIQRCGADLRAGQQSSRSPSRSAHNACKGCHGNGQAFTAATSSFPKKTVGSDRFSISYF